MRSGLPAWMVPGLVVCLAVAGCSTKGPTAGVDASPQPFVRSLADPGDYHLLLTGKPQTWGMRSGRVRLAPGKSIGLHNTKGNEEVLIFLAGSGVAVLGEQTRLEVGAGRAAYLPPQTAHDVLNTGTGPLIYVFCVAPARAGR